MALNTWVNLNGENFQDKELFTWLDGVKYVGEFKAGKRHGQGTYTWTKMEKLIMVSGKKTN